MHPDKTVTTPRVSAIGLSLNGRSTGSYRWATWNRVSWHERRKAGWSEVRRAFLAAG